MGIVVDTSVLIAAERGRIGLDETLSRFGDQSVVVAAITASELLHGVERARLPGVRERRNRFVEQILEEIPVAEFGLEEARIHAKLWAHLQASGKLIGYHDLLIAATALRLGFSVATLNEREFRQVPNLQMFAL